MRNFDNNLMVPETLKIMTLGNVASTAVRRLRSPLSLRLVTNKTLPPRPPIANRPILQHLGKPIVEVETSSIEKV